MELELWQIVSVVVALIAGGGFGVWRALKLVPREVGELLLELANAIEDDKVTRKELQALIEQWVDVQEVLFNVSKQLGKTFSWLKF